MQTQIFYKSDFSAILAFDGGWTTPFRLKFWTNSPSRSFTASYDGETYTNCQVTDDGRLLIAFDSHNMGLGTLTMQPEFYLSAEEFADGVCNEVITPFAPTFTDTDGTEYTLALGLTGASTITTIGTLPAYYKKGDKGDGSQVTVAQVQTEGTHIADITIDGEKTEIYAPKGGSGDGKVKDVTVDGTSVLDEGTGVAAIDLTGIEGDIDDLNAAVFPLVASYGTNNSGTREVGTSVTPTAALNITRKSVDVAASATVTVTPSATVAADHKSFTGTALSSGSATYKASITQGGQTVNLGNLTWSFTYYRYYGEVSSVPTNYATAIKALSKKELSTTTTLDTTALSANKYFLFAVKGDSVTLKCKHAETGGEIGGCVTGTCSVTQENDKTKTNTYSYILVPKASSAWNFKITNS